MTAVPDDALLARAFDAAPHGAAVVAADGRIVAANAALDALVGARPGALVGTALAALLPEAVGAAGGSTRLHRADGVDVDVEVVLTPLGDGLRLASVADIGDRVALEWAFRDIFDASPYGLAIVADDGRIVLANRILAEALGHTPAGLAGQPLDVLLPERYRRDHGAMMAGYRAEGSARMMGRGRDLTALHADGTEVPVEIGLSRVRWQRQWMTLAAISDISVRKRLELDLRQANANLQEFTYVASHDLRSPLRGIADLVEWIEADLGDSPPPEVAKNLGRVGTRVKRMEQLIDDLLSYARAGRAATEYTRVDVAELVARVLEIQPPPPGIDVAVDIDVAPFLATRTPLETALRNVIGNAFKHHDRDAGSVRVVARESGSYCEIAVVDDGPGVPAGARERIFKLFQTLTPRAAAGGSGIGLALTKRIVEVHGGRVEIDSPVADGRGAKFRIWWPRFPRRTRDDA